MIRRPKSSNVGETSTSGMAQQPRREGWLSYFAKSFRKSGAEKWITQKFLNKVDSRQDELVNTALLKKGILSPN